MSFRLHNQGGSSLAHAFSRSLRGKGEQLAAKDLLQFSEQESFSVSSGHSLQVLVLRRPVEAMANIFVVMIGKEVLGFY